MRGRMSRVKTLLRTGGDVCSIECLYGDALSEGRNDISTLIRRGWVIDKTWHDHGVERHVHYRLLRESPAKQLALRIA